MIFESASHSLESFMRHNIETYPDFFPVLTTSPLECFVKFIQEQLEKTSTVDPEERYRNGILVLSQTKRTLLQELKQDFQNISRLISYQRRSAAIIAMALGLTEEESA